MPDQLLTCAACGVRFVWTGRRASGPLSHVPAAGARCRDGRAVW